MNIFFEPVNVNQWNMFEKVTGIGHVEPFYATKSVDVGDLVLLHVGSQNKNYISGIYAYGTVVQGPYIAEDHPENHTIGMNYCDVRIDYICYGNPLISHAEASKFINQFRSVHKIDEEYYDEILSLIGQ